jgi:osmotically inducible protein OsmC
MRNGQSFTKESAMTQLEKRVLYTAKVHTSRGRDSSPRCADGRLDTKPSTLGIAGNGTNPEQLFANGWSACFENAIGIAARKMNLPLPANLAIDTEVDLCVTGYAYSIQARLNVSLPGLKREVAHALVNAAHQTSLHSTANLNQTHLGVDSARRDWKKENWRESVAG